MTCNDALAYLAAYLDDELGVADSIRVEQHLAVCLRCRRYREEALALRSVIVEADLFERPAPELANRVRDAVRAAARKEFPQRSRFRTVPLVWAAAAVFAAAGLTALFLTQRGRSSEQTLVASEIVDEHIRSLQAGHLLDVPSSDRHTVKPWFQGKLDFAPSVPDLSDRGWILQGGRLGYVNGRSVAVLVYQRRKHEINVFLWPNRSRPDEAIRQQEAQGYHVLHWSGPAMTYWVVSDLDPAELRQFASLLRGR
jgi:anti-sigma factor RsiW